MIRTPQRIPYPLPQKRQRPKSGIARAPKRIWLRHRKFVRSHQCCVPGCQALLVDVAHLRSVEMGSGTSLKPHDRYTVPLCRHHHLEQEPAGPDAFGDRHGIDLWAIAEELVRTSPDTQMRLQLMLEEQAGPPRPLSDPGSGRVPCEPRSRVAARSHEGAAGETPNPVRDPAALRFRLTGTTSRLSRLVRIEGFVS